MYHTIFRWFYFVMTVLWVNLKVIGRMDRINLVNLLLFQYAIFNVNLFIYVPIYLCIFIYLFIYLVKISTCACKSKTLYKNLYWRKCIKTLNSEGQFMLCLTVIYFKYLAFLFILIETIVLFHFNRNYSFISF